MEFAKIPGESGWILDMIFWKELITKLSDFSSSKSSKATVQGHHDPSQLDVKAQLLLVFNIMLHNLCEVGSPWANPASWLGSFGGVSKDLISWPLLAGSGCWVILFLLKITKIIPLVMVLT